MTENKRNSRISSNRINSRTSNRAKGRSTIKKYMGPIIYICWIQGHNI